MCLPTASGSSIDRRIAISGGGRASDQRAPDQASGDPCADVAPKAGGIRLAGRDRDRARGRARESARPRPDLARGAFPTKDARD